MILTLSSQQMLQVWRKAAGLEPYLDSCSVESFDGIDVNSRLTTLMRRWYLALLDDAPPALLAPPSDASSLVTLGPVRAGRAALLTDSSVRRLISVRLSSWQRPATVLAASEAKAAIAMLDNPYCAAGPVSPLAWRDAAGVVCVSPAADGDTLAEASAIIDPGDDCYILDELALTSVPDDIVL